jgi:hypothetical protein
VGIRSIEHLRRGSLKAHERFVESKHGPVPARWESCAVCPRGSREEPAARRRIKTAMNLEETIAVAVGITVAIAFLVFFVFGVGFPFITG